MRTMIDKFESASERRHKMARILLFAICVTSVLSLNPTGEMTLENVTRLATGDIFSLLGSDCGPTRCMEISHGTSLAALGGDSSTCICRCRRDTPTFREDQRVCVNHIDECFMAAFGREGAKLNIPFVFLPLKGQIIYPSKEIVFTDVDDAVCAVTSAQYLSTSGWVTIRDLIDNDVPFGLYRDEGNTFLQWRGSSALHTRLEGRLIAVHVLCSASTSSRLVASCAAFRVAGASHNGLLDVRSIPFHAGEIVAADTVSQNQGLSVLESLAIGVCVLMLIFVYAAGIIFYIHYKQRQKRKRKDPELNISSSFSENGSPLESRIDMSNVMLKTNPLLNLSGLGSDFFSSDNGFPDVSEYAADTVETASNNMPKFQKMTKTCNIISAMVHSQHKKPTRPSIRSVTSTERFTERLYRRAVSSDTLERAPHSDLSIVDYNVENNTGSGRASNTESAFRKKLYFNPEFFELEQLKNPSPAAVEFLTKIREVMSVAKEKMTSKRFVPMLSDIPEEDLYRSIDLGWDFPCARRGRRFSAISLKHENSRKSVQCGGCPGCDSKAKPQKAVALTRSNSCKSCVSEDYKQKIVRKWLDEVPTPSVTKKNISCDAQNGIKKLEIEMKSNEGQPKSSEPIKSEEYKLKIKDMKPGGIRVLKLTKEDIVIPDHTFELDTNLDKMENKPNSKNIKQDIYRRTTRKVVTAKANTSNNNDSNKEEKPATTNQISKTSDFIKNEENKLGRPIISSPRPISNNFMQEIKSPSSHNSRQIRKKLPPPPPPPVNVSETSKAEDQEPVALEVKVKMQAVIRELYGCQQVEPVELEEVKMETVSPIAPKIVIPVIAADSHYFSDDNMIMETNQNNLVRTQNDLMDYDSLERNAMKHRRFSIACRPELSCKEYFMNIHSLDTMESLINSSRGIKKSVNKELKMPKDLLKSEKPTQRPCEVFIDNTESLYNNISKPGPLTIQVRGSPLHNRRHSNEDFDPDTLDRKPKRDVQKRVEKILLKSAGSFKQKSSSSEIDAQKKTPDITITKKIGNLRQIYEAKAKAQTDETKFYNRRGSIPYGRQDIPAYIKPLKTPDLIRHIENQNDPKPPVPPKGKRSNELSPKFLNIKREGPPSEYRRSPEERERFSGYARFEHLNARKSGRRSARTRSRRTDLRKLYRTEDSGYMSTDSNESKRKATYLMQLRPKLSSLEPLPVPAVRTIIKSPILPIESDTDEFESLGDGRSESGGESVETDSVFFGNCDDSKELFAELGLRAFEPYNKAVQVHEQIDSGFMGETNIILSGDSDSEHRSVISILTGRDDRASASSVSKLDDSPYLHTIEC